MKEHNGHRSWNAWNVSLYINNEYHLYQLAMDCIKQHPTAYVARFIRYSTLLGDKTPDGAVYNHLSIKLALDALKADYDEYTSRKTA